MKIKHILVADDEDAVVHLIRTALESRGEFCVDAVPTADGALRRLAAAVPDALLLDTTLPDLPAQEVCRAIRARERTRALPCIMLGDAVRGLTVVDGLEVGADDCVMKPLDPRELEARLRAVLRRREPARPEPVSPAFQGQRIMADFADVSVVVDGSRVALTRRELLLLRALVEQCNHTLSRETLLATVWGTQAWDCRVVDSAMWKLRKKLKDAGRQIETVVGFGYRFNEPRA
ncbi:MAG TPA: response regulator transcription factor [Vicinamibacterales bacterium]|nr:response regulator transcription factor [Vicinamibacterales bacterium]